MANNPLANHLLRYVIGTDYPGDGLDHVATVVGYDVSRPVKRGVSIAYCNLYSERGAVERYAPYLQAKPGTTASNYNEGHIDPTGKGFALNLNDQFARRKKQGFKFIELDNPDGYAIKDVIRALDLAMKYGFQVVAKNPLLLPGASCITYVMHPAIVGAIVEQGAGWPEPMDELRHAAGKPNLPVWFVAFGDGRIFAKNAAKKAAKFPMMRASYSTVGEYENAVLLA